MAEAGFHDATQCNQLWKFMLPLQPDGSSPSVPKDLQHMPEELIEHSLNMLKTLSDDDFSSRVRPIFKYIFQKDLQDCDFSKMLWRVTRKRMGRKQRLITAFTNALNGTQDAMHVSMRVEDAQRNSASIHAVAGDKVVSLVDATANINVQMFFATGEDGRSLRVNVNRLNDSNKHSKLYPPGSNLAEAINRVSLAISFFDDSHDTMVDCVSSTVAQMVYRVQRDRLVFGRSGSSKVQLSEELRRYATQ